MNIKQVCEVCFDEPANSLTHDPVSGSWYFCCQSCLPEGYCIDFERLGEQDWYEHMAKKNWVNMFEFRPRFKWALRCHNEKKKK